MKKINYSIEKVSNTQCLAISFTASGNKQKYLQRNNVCLILKKRFAKENFIYWI